MHISEQKKILRQEIGKRINGLSDDERHAEGRTLSRLVLQKLPPPPITVCAYFPLKSEADIRLLLGELFKRGDAVFLPIYNAAKQAMFFRRAENLRDLPPGAFSIPEPKPDAEDFGDRTATVILVPGRAFDKTGRRLGRGSGGYDQWLASYRLRCPETPLWGTCLLCQIVAQVPLEDHDVTMDAVVTAKEFIVCHSGYGGP